MSRFILALLGRNWYAKCLCCGWASGRADMDKHQALARASMHKINFHNSKALSTTISSWPARVIYVERLT